MCSEQELEKTRPGHHASALARRPTTELELVTTPRMVAERLVASLQSLHGWGRCFQSRVVRTRPRGSRWTKPLIGLQKGDLAWFSVAEPPTSETDPESDSSVADARDPAAVEKAHEQATRKWRNPETDVGDSEEDIGFREVVSGPVKNVYYTIILGAVPVVVLESCERCSDSVRVNMFGLAQRVHIPSLRTAHHAALAPLAATAPNKLDLREGCLHRGAVCCLRTSNCVLSRCSKT